MRVRRRQQPRTMAAASTAVRGGDASVSGGSPRKSSSPRRLLAGNAYRCPWRVSEGPRHLCEHGCYFVAYEPSRFLHAFTGGSRVAGLQPRVVCWLARRRAAAAATGCRWRRAGRWRRTHASGEGTASRPPCRTRSSSRPARSTYSNLPEAVQALAADRFPARREAAASVASPARSSLSNHAAGGDAVACAGGGGDGGGDDVRGRRGGAGLRGDRILHPLAGAASTTGAHATGLLTGVPQGRVQPPGRAPRLRQVWFYGSDR